MKNSVDQQDWAFPPSSDTQPIIGGETEVTLTSASTLETLGVTVSVLGSATLETDSATPVVEFPITGGTDFSGVANDVILHQGSGLELSDSAGTLDLTDFRIDTLNGVVNANVTANGASVGNVALFDLGSDGTTLTLTDAAASVANQVLGTTAITSSVVIGTATPSPVIDPMALGIDHHPLRFLHAACSNSTSITEPIIGGTTAVTLTSASTLGALGVTVTPSGSASLNADGASPVANFPITGGTDGADADVILHQGSGLQLTDSAGTLTLNDFLIDTQNGVVNANVTANGIAAGNVAVFDIAKDGSTLTLTSTAAGVANQVLGTSAFTSSIVIGTAEPVPVALPGRFASWLVNDVQPTNWSAHWH